MGYIHAAAMAEYAKDAAETDKPWERWEVSFNDGFVGVTGHPNWSVNHQYRRKPKVFLINGHLVPEPCRTPLQDGEGYWTFTFFTGVFKVFWDSESEDHNALKNGFVHLTKEAAEEHFEALKSITAIGEQRPPSQSS